MRIKEIINENLFVFPGDFRLRSHWSCVEAALIAPDTSRQNEATWGYLPPPVPPPLYLSGKNTHTHIHSGDWVSVCVSQGLVCKCGFTCLRGFTCGYTVWVTIPSLALWDRGISSHAADGRAHWNFSAHLRRSCSDTSRVTVGTLEPGLPPEKKHCVRYSVSVSQSSLFDIM